MIRKVTGIAIVLVCAAMSLAATDSNCTAEVLGNFRVVCVADDIIKASPIVENGKVVLRTQSGLEVFDLATGKKLWSKPIATEAKFIRKPFVKNGVIYLAERLAKQKENLLAFDLLTGEKTWNKELNGSFVLTFFEPIMHEGTIYISTTHEVYALDSKTGRTIWSIGDGPFDYFLILKDSKIIAYDLNKFAFLQIDCNSGKYQTMPEAEYSFCGPGVLMKDGVKICYIGFKIPESGTEEALVCIDYESGKTYWKTSLNDNYITAKLYFYESGLYNTAYLSDLSEFILHRYDVNSGKLLWETKLDKATNDFSDICFKGDFLYWSNVDSLYCISIKDGKILSKYKGQDLGGVAIDSDKMLIAEGRKLLIVDDLKKLCK